MDYINIPDISFIGNETIDSVLADMISDFKEEYTRITGKSYELYPANPYRLLMYTMALRYGQGLQYLDRAGKMNLPKYSEGDFLDNLVQIYRISRKGAAAAKTVLEFSIESPIASAVSIPLGTRVTNKNNVFFTTDEYTEIPPGQTTIRVNATCTEPGLGGLVSSGDLNTVVDVLPYILTVRNIGDSFGASDRESDEDLTIRTFRAPKAFSVAGPTGAYEYFAYEASSEIGNVVVPEMTAPGDVDVFITTKDGEEPSSELIQRVYDFLDDRTKRPLSDNVTIKVPEYEEFSVDITYYVSDASRVDEIKAAVEAAVDEYVAWQTERIGRDINPSYLIKKVMEAGAKRVEVTSPEFTSVTANTVPKVDEVDLTYGGIESD